jgi:hypothetical protein
MSLLMPCKRRAGQNGWPGNPCEATKSRLVHPGVKRVVKPARVPEAADFELPAATERLSRAGRSGWGRLGLRHEAACDHVAPHGVLIGGHNPEGGMLGHQDGEIVGVQSLGPARLGWCWTNRVEQPSPDRDAAPGRTGRSTPALQPAGASGSPQRVQVVEELGLDVGVGTERERQFALDHHQDREPGDDPGGAGAPR